MVFQKKGWKYVSTIENEKTASDTTMQQSTVQKGRI